MEQITLIDTPSIAYGACSAKHADCPNGSGSCEREPAHDGSHHCGSCGQMF
jgi:hypothetical protein